MKDMWDVCVIGGGASGMMAAGRASECGARTILLEKNAQLGKKLLITGGGRCNVTNAEGDTRALLSKFNSRGRAADQFLFSPFSRHSVEDSIEFFNTRGMPTNVEAKGRVFPKSNTAQSVWEVLFAYMQEGYVKVASNAHVVRIAEIKGVISYVQLKNDQRIYAKQFILATGGMSRPDTGSTGDGFAWLGELGHNVARPDPSLVPLTIENSWVPSLAGVALADIALSLREKGKKRLTQKGDLLFTHKGISGPAALNISKDVGERLPYGSVVLSLDLFPKEGIEALDTRMRELVKNESNKLLKNVLSQLVQSKLVSVVLGEAGIAHDVPAHSLTREARNRLVHVLKNMTLTVKGRLGFEKAIIASGGCALSDIDTKTMRSKIVQNLYIIGDLLDIDRPSGGYSLQLCWTTGVVAGGDAARRG